MKHITIQLIYANGNAEKKLSDFSVNMSLSMFHWPATQNSLGI